MPEMNTDQPKCNDVNNANNDGPTQAGEGKIQAEAQTCMYFLHKCGLIDPMKT
jgi:hypothetical protein